MIWLVSTGVLTQLQMVKKDGWLQHNLSQLMHEELSHALMNLH
jgi:hypothetical protein